MACSPPIPQQRLEMEQTRGSPQRPHKIRQLTPKQRLMMNRSLHSMTFRLSPNRLARPQLCNDRLDIKQLPPLAAIHTETKPKSDMGNEGDSVLNDEKKSSTTRKRIVKFDPIPNIRAALSISQYSQEELESCWYSLQERQRLATERDFDIRRLESGQRKSKTCLRGLEAWTSEGVEKQKRRYKILIDAIMQDQEQQSSGSKNYEGRNEEQLASISMRVSLVSKANALLMAEMDQKDALKASFQIGSIKRRELLLDNSDEDFERRILESSSDDDENDEDEYRE